VADKLWPLARQRYRAALAHSIYRPAASEEEVKAKQAELDAQERTQLLKKIRRRYAAKGQQPPLALGAASFEDLQDHYARLGVQ
jgi:hypothetical protein